MGRLSAHRVLKKYWWIPSAPELAFFQVAVITVGKMITCKFNNISTGMINGTVIGPIGISWSETFMNLSVLFNCFQQSDSIILFMLFGERFGEGGGEREKDPEIRLWTDSGQLVLVQNHFPIC